MALIDRSIPILTLAIGALLAWRDASWPGYLAFTSALALYAGMRFLERFRANEMQVLSLELRDLRSRVSDLAMRSGSGGGIL